MTHSHLRSAEYFVEPRQAFQIVGQEVFGDAWREDCIDNPADEDHRETLALLRQALRSGDVAAHWATLDARSDGDLRPQDADREFFRIQIKDDLVFHQGVNQPVRCRIHAEQLRRFLRGQEMQPVTPSQLAANKCFDWLVETFSDNDREIPRAETLRKLAKERFPRLSDHAFKDARRRAIEKTARQDLAKPGRRRNLIGE
ncbi:hypothetical protein [Pyruvatibacter mobilis]|uniref:hypothetical protein n=1 Tax=Pyruvatibacter mobilis TaxID=1712261 RepID=UPI003BAA9B38